MKVHISSYPTWVGPYQVASALYFWGNEEEQHAFGEWLSNTRVGHWITQAGEKWLDFWSNRRVFVRIDPYDTWSMDFTLSYIIVPMLIQLQKDKHGAPLVDDEDVPKELRSTPTENEWDIDEHFFARWDWVMNEMIWAFTEHTQGDGLTNFVVNGQVDQKGLKEYEQRKRRAFSLFGKYYQNLWD